jgi:hypothetical protein
MTTADPAPVPPRWRRRLGRGALGLAVAWALLSIPEPAPEVPAGPGAEPFAWDRDALWSRLEALVDRTRAEGCPPTVVPRLRELDGVVGTLERDAPGPDDPRWDALEAGVFESAALVVACGEGLPELLALRGRLRRVAKDASMGWPVDRPARDRLYRLLYGTRAAVEEVLLQVAGAAGATAFEPAALALERGDDEPSATPWVEVEGVRVHSGDLLLSRGGAPTSAFIARGSDYPGNFSHVALVHVSEAGEGSVIEAHIERGVAVTDAAGYLADKKLRILVLRLRADHPALVADPLLPHRAAAAALEEARARHIPYDFAMDVRDHGERFCSEVASAAYGGQGVELWRHLSTFSSPGLARWMAGFGVRHLETHGPSDLEYDPQLRVVAEWHDPDTLLRDHVHNAAIDAMLEQAEAGAPLDHAAWMLPVARVLKAYSAVKVAFGGEGPIPEGMSATTALRAQWLAERHGAIEACVLARARGHEAQHGRRPPYWTLVALARDCAR